MKHIYLVFRDIEVTKYIEIRVPIRQGTTREVIFLSEYSNVELHPTRTFHYVRWKFEEYTLIYRPMASSFGCIPYRRHTVVTIFMA